jgi:hypothetical protein
VKSRLLWLDLNRGVRKAELPERGSHSPVGRADAVLNQFKLDACFTFRLARLQSNLRLKPL